MATIHHYSNRDGIYVRNSFRSGTQMIHVVYQVTNEAKDRLLSLELESGENIPNGIFHELLRTGDLYTKRSGAGTSSVEENYTETSDMLLDGLSPQGLKWVTALLVSHPSSRVVGITSEEGVPTGVEVEGTPENFVKAIFHIAKRYDGTDIFDQIDKAFEKLHKSRNNI